MGRLVRRFIRCHGITITNEVRVDRSIAINHVGAVYGERTIIDVPDGITQSGYLRGSSIEMDVGDGSIVDNYWSGMHIAMTAHAGASLAQVSCIYISNFVEIQPTYRYTFLDFRDNAPGIHVNCFAYVRVASDMLNLFELHSITTAWSLVNNPPGGIAAADGRIAVMVGGAQRYIALFQ